MSTLGLTHTVFGIVALLAGTAVLFLRKGGRWHRTLGHVYLTSMLALNISALFIYRLFDGFGPFHWLALFSLVTLIAAMVPLFTHRPRDGWLARHGLLMSISYVGLVAATASEITSRLPGTEDAFGLVVGLTSGAIIGVSPFLIYRYMPGALQRTPARFRRTP